MGKEKAPGSAPYGAWRSPITAQMVAAGQIGVSEPHPEPGAVSWLELRPSEGGRYVLVRATDDGRTLDVTPPGTNVRTRVHEYGGGAFLVKGETVFFSNFEDQRLFRLDGDGQPRPITPEPPERGAHRYADGRLTPDGRWFVCVRERHEGGEPVNELVAIPADGSSSRTRRGCDATAHASSTRRCCPVDSTSTRRSAKSASPISSRRSSAFCLDSASRRFVAPSAASPAAAP